MVKNPSKKLLTTFYIILTIVIILIVSLFGDNTRSTFIVLAILAFIASILGIYLVILTQREKIKGKLKFFLVLVGIAPIFMILGSILHNFVYALGIYFLGQEFWGTGGDEPFFFIISIIVAPLIFLVGVIGSFVMMIKKH
jgi:hypothetical protein